MNNIKLVYFVVSAFYDLEVAKYFNNHTPGVGVNSLRVKQIS